jgi:hypothetical protein
MLWLYHFAWGFLLLLSVKPVVVSLMHRYPGGHLSTEASQLFLAEAQFRLMKTDISHSYLWLLLAFAVIRMLLTPLLNAGIFFSLRHPDLNSGYRFLLGIRKLGKPFLGYYALQTLFTLAPLYWLYPIAKAALGQYGDYTSIAVALLPWICGYLLYGFLLRLCFVYVQLGRAAEDRLGRSLSQFIRRLPVIVGLALLVLALSSVATASVLSVSLLWAGVSAFVLQQMFHFVNMLFKLWSIAAQYHVYANDAK